MSTLVICKEVRPATGGGKRCVVIASRDERPGVGAIDASTPSTLAEVRERLRTQGVLLWGPLQPAQRLSTPSRPASPVQIIALDEHGHERRLVADNLEEYSLSTGSALYYLHVAETPGDCGWLVGRTVEVAEVGTRPPAGAEQEAAPDPAHT